MTDWKRPIQSSVTVDLPFPPSVNSIWRGSGRRVYRSAKYKAWALEAGQEINRQRPGRIEGHFTAQIQIGRPDKRRRDIDNLAKVLLDLMGHHGIVDDDSYAIALLLNWSDEVKGARIVLEAA